MFSVGSFFVQVLIELFWLEPFHVKYFYDLYESLLSQVCGLFMYFEIRNSNSFFIDDLCWLDYLFLFNLSDPVFG